jgi:hypothetical protein
MVAIAVILPTLILVRLPLFASTEGVKEDLKQLVMNELGKYIEKQCPYYGECIYTNRWTIRYNISGKGIIDMGDAYTFQRFEDFINELANESDPHGYIMKLKENLENPKQHPNATFGGGDPWDYIEPSLSAEQGVTYTTHRMESHPTPEN